jgi:endonuclease YncB( thermonuclease family)
MFYRIIKNNNLKRLPPDGVYTVAGVRDGDSVYLRHGKKLVHVRLNGIDTPELKQPAGRDAKQFLSHLILHHAVRVRFHGKGKYSRAIADLYIKNTNVALFLLSSGYAWVYVAYCPSDRLSSWLKHQNRARSAKVGLWDNDNPIQPWVYRRFKRML